MPGGILLKHSAHQQARRDLKMEALESFERLPSTFLLRVSFQLDMGSSWEESETHTHTLREIDTSTLRETHTETHTKRDLNTERDKHIEATQRHIETSTLRRRNTH